MSNLPLPYSDYKNQLIKTNSESIFSDDKLITDNIEELEKYVTKRYEKYLETFSGQETAESIEYDKGFNDATELFCQQSKNKLEVVFNAGREYVSLIDKNSDNVYAYPTFNDFINHIQE